MPVEMLISFNMLVFFNLRMPVDHMLKVLMTQIPYRRLDFYIQVVAVVGSSTNVAEVNKSITSTINNISCQFL